MDWSLVTPEAMASLDIEALLAPTEKREVFAYGTTLSPHCADEARWMTEQLACLRLLQGMLQMMLHPMDPSTPFGPLIVVAGKSSCVPSDIPKDVLKNLHPWVVTLSDDELRARLLDIIWTQGRHFPSALAAVDAYVAAAKERTGAETWYEAYDRFQRALRLATSLSRGGFDAKAQTLAAIKDAVDQAADDGSPLRRRLIGLLLEFEHGEPADLGARSSAIGLADSTRGSFFFASEAHSLAAACYLRAGDEVARAREQAAAAEALASEAEAALLRPGQGAMAAAAIMGDAVSAMRQAAGGFQRATEMHTRMLAWQREALAQFAEISVPVNVGNATQKAMDDVRGKTFRDATRALCAMGGAPRIDGLRQAVHREAQIGIMGALMPLNVANYRGRTVAVIPPLTPGIQDTSDEGLRGRIYQVARRQREIQVAAVINPARMEIWAEHYPTRQDIIELLRYSACVPQGHAESFTRALLAGFEGDMVVVAHLVPAQFEAMVRHILEGAGGETSILAPNRAQPERTLKPLLELEQATKVFGEDAVFEMHDLLIDSLGGNLRNEALHGLMSDEQMGTSEVLYAWWLLLRYCVVSALLVEQRLFAPPKPGAGAAGTTT